MPLLLAEGATVIQTDIAGVVSIVTAIVVGLSGGMMGAAKLFVGYQTAKDEKHKADDEAYTANLETIIRRVEAMVASGDAKDAKHDAEFRLLYDKLLSLHVETAKTMGEMRTAIVALSERVGRIEKFKPRGNSGGEGER